MTSPGDNYTDTITHSLTFCIQRKSRTIQDNFLNGNSIKKAFVSMNKKKGENANTQMLNSHKFHNDKATVSK